MMRAARPRSTCLRKTAWNSIECSRLWFSSSTYGSYGQRSAMRSMASKSADSGPNGVSNAFRQSAKGCSIGACDVPNTTNVSASSASPSRSAA